jgi:hypothetical protein
MRPEDVELEPEVVDMLRRLPPSAALRAIDRLVARAAELDEAAVNATEARAVQTCEAGLQQPGGDRWRGGMGSQRQLERRS